MCPGTCKVASLDDNEGMKMHLAKLYFFYSSLFPLTPYIFVFTSDVPFSTFLFLKAQPTRAIAVKCDGGVYRIDVDVDKFYTISCYMYQYSKDNFYFKSEKYNISYV